MSKKSILRKGRQQTKTAAKKTSVAKKQEVLPTHKTKSVSPSHDFPCEKSTIHNKDVISNQIVTDSSIAHIIDNTVDNSRLGKEIYYISDLHLDMQIDNNTSPQDFLKTKFAEMMQSNPTPNSLLLIGGDMSNRGELVSTFFELIKKYWSGTILYVLGNHELWFNDLNGLDGIVERYSNIVTYETTNCNSFLLQNALYLSYSDGTNHIMEEADILNSNPEEIQKICSNATNIVLGGIGFSGLNKVQNASSGVYLFTINTIEEDKALSARFKKVYDKIKQSIGDREVVVLTHNPAHDWMDEPYQPGWVYINGHTHWNQCVQKDGAIILSNQIGYIPSKWKLQCYPNNERCNFSKSECDPLKDLKDGIHKISIEQYRDFYSWKGISMKSENLVGDVFALKKNNYYLFLLKNGSKHKILCGACERNAKYEIEYYYDKMESYIEHSKSIFSKFRKTLKQVSEEIKSIGGNGNIHGCIIDIDYFNHIEISPTNQKVSIYNAIDNSKKSKKPYSNLTSLYNIEIPEKKKKLAHFLRKNKESLLAKIEKGCNASSQLLPFECLPGKLFANKDKPTSTMKEYQYLFEYNIIRRWNDEILRIKCDSDK